MKQLLIIPGLGDRAWLYRLAVPVWAVLGFKARVFTFGWSGYGPYKERASQLQACIARLDSPVYIIGASAGGTAAVNALASRPERVAKVLTIATPYDDMPALGNPLLSDSIAEMKASLRHMDGETRRRIVSMHGEKDTIVPIHKSQPPGVMTMQLRVNGHARTIFLALTFYGKMVRGILA